MMINFKNEDQPVLDTQMLDALKELRGDSESDLLPILCFGSLYSAGDIRRACGIYKETAE